MTGFIADELRAQRKDLVRAHRKLAMADLPGTVVAQNADNWTVQLLLGTDPTTGAQVLSPWLKPASGSNQPGFKVSPPLPPIGSRMRMKSPSGVVGADSYAEPAAFDAGQGRPSGQAASQGLISFGSARLAFTDGQIALTVGGEGFTLSGSGLQMSATFTAKGGSRPAAYQGAATSDGATITQGNSNLLV